MPQKPIDVNAVNLKHEYENIFRIQILEETFIVRPLSKFEFNELVIKTDNSEHPGLVEDICNLCTLAPEDYNFSNPINAGTPEALKQKIVEISGFHDGEGIKETLDVYRNQNENNFDHKMQNIIMAAFPSVRLEEMRDWSIYKMLDYYARAEFVIANMRKDMKLPWKQEQQQQPGQGQNTPGFDNVMGEGISDFK